MDYNIIERKIKKGISELFLNRDRNDPMSDYEMRLRKMVRKVSNHHSFMKDRQRRIDSFYKLISDIMIAKDMLTNGKKIIAFDVERMGNLKTEFRHISEIGISYVENGEIVVEHYHIKDQPIKHPFLYGQTQFITMDELKDIISVKIDTADCFVGHSMGNDFSYLKNHNIKIKHKPIFDTAVWSGYIELSNANGQVESLSTMANRFGVNIKHPHNGGNDAYYNMQLFVKIIEAVNNFKRIGQTSKFIY